MVVSRVAIRKVKAKEQIVALFRGRDANIPILTRLYQLTVPENWAEEPERLFESELIAFLEWDKSYYYGMPEDQETQEEEVQNNFQDLISDKNIAYLASLAKKREITGLMLDSVTSTNTVTPLCLHCLNEWSREYLIDALIPRFDIPPSIERDSEYTELTPIPLESVEVFCGALQPDEQIVTEARQVITGELRAARCGECENPFVFKPWKSQRFCSHRCHAHNRNRSPDTCGTVPHD